MTLRYLISVTQLLALMTLCGCGVSQAKLDIERLERSQEDVRSFQAEQTTQISALRNEVRMLTGRVEELEHSQSQSSVGSEISTLKRDLSTLRRRVPPPALVPVAALEADEALAAGLSPEIGKPLDDALIALREGSYSVAVPMLQSLLDSGGGSQWTANVLFWLAVAYDGSGETKRSLTTYNDLVTNFPKHERTPLALLRQGSLLIRFGDKQTAGLVFKKLVAEYPKTAEAAQARERLRDL